MMIQVNLYCLLHVSQKWDLATNSPELSLLKILPFIYHHSHFLAANLDFTTFFTMDFWGLHPFLQLGCFVVDTTSFCICVLKAGHRPLGPVFFLYYKKYKQDAKLILNIHFFY